MGKVWVSEFCPQVVGIQPIFSVLPSIQAELVVKTDDDQYVDMYEVSFIHTIPGFYLHYYFLVI